jgi:signal recognition particle subunit SRP54
MTPEGPAVFDTLSDRLSASLRNLRGKGRLSPSDVDAACRDIRVALLDADVALPVVTLFVAAIRERALGTEVSGALNPAQQVIKIVHEQLVELLGSAPRRIRWAKTPPTVIMLAGLQGAGKTTLAGKLAELFRSEGHTPLLVACDLQRPQAVAQLRVVAERAGVPVFAPEPGDGVGDPVSVAAAALRHARGQLHDVVIVDTAGRLGVDSELMNQATAIRDAVQPDEILFVVDAMIGQDAVATANAFLDGVGFDGVVLTKLDGDARGGAALSIAKLTGRPVMYASVGEKLSDLDVFHPERMASRILGMGDVLTLIEQAERAFDADQKEAMAAKLQTGTDFTLDDFLAQMQAVKRMGSLTKLLGMLPGMGEMKEQLANVDDRDLDRVAAIIQSMTPAERTDPKILNGSRRQRIARGAGTEVSEVNGMVERFAAAQKMMRQMSAGRVPGMPGSPRSQRGKDAKERARQQRRGVRGRSGNPAKRAQGVYPMTGSEPASTGSESGASRQPFELPAQLRDLLPPESR